MPQCMVSFGANLGSRDSAIVMAARRLAALPGVENFRASRLYETPAIGGPQGQSSFLNAVAVFDTRCRASEVLDWLQQIEHDLGRERHVRWAARSIDLDVVLHGSLVGGASNLTVPHPRYTARRFVLRPACDVAPDYCDPRFGWTIQQLADHLDRGNASLALTGGDEHQRSEICDLLESQHQIHVIRAVPFPEPMRVRGTAPMPTDGTMATLRQGAIEIDHQQPWVSEFVPTLPSADDPATALPSTPRLIARIQWLRPEERWPAPHRIWPSRLQWPEYRLETDQLAWAAGEIAAALVSMRCSIEPIDDRTDWWH